MVEHEPGDLLGVVTPDFAKASILVRTNLSGSRAHRGDARQDPRATSPSTSRPSCRVRPTGNLVLLTGTTSDIVTGQIEEPDARARRHLRRDVADVPVGAHRLPGDPAERAADPHLLRRDGLARHPAEPRHQPDRRDRARHRRRLDDPLHGAAQPRAARRDRPGGGDRAHAAHRRRADRLHDGRALRSASSPSRSRASCRSRTSASSPASPW